MTRDKNAAERVEMLTGLIDDLFSMKVYLHAQGLPRFANQANKAAMLFVEERDRMRHDGDHGE